MREIKELKSLNRDFNILIEEMACLENNIIRINCWAKGDLDIMDYYLNTCQEIRRDIWDLINKTKQVITQANRDVDNIHRKICKNKFSKK